MRLQHDAAVGLGVIEHLEQQVLVPIGGVMLQAFLIHPLSFRADLCRLGGREKAADYGVALGMELCDQILHQRIIPLYACQVAWPSRGATMSSPQSRGA